MGLVLTSVTATLLPALPGKRRLAVGQYGSGEKGKADRRRRMLRQSYRCEYLLMVAVRYGCR